jgi:hypothetical protein
VRALLLAKGSIFKILIPALPDLEASPIFIYEPILLRFVVIRTNVDMATQDAAGSSEISSNGEVLFAVA